MITDKYLKHWMFDPPSMKQLEYIFTICDALEIPKPSNMSKMEASVFLETYELAFKQEIVKYIKQKGYQQMPVPPQQTSFQDNYAPPVKDNEFPFASPVGTKEEYVEPSGGNGFSFPTRLNTIKDWLGGLK